MLSQSSPLIALLVAAAAFVLLSWLLRASQRQQELRAALEALSAMKRSEFAHHVAAVLAQRGLRADGGQRNTADDAVALSMTRGSAHYLVHCHQSREFRVSQDTVRSFAEQVRSNGSAGGILVTTGAVHGSARREAGTTGVELIAGKPLWRQLRPLVPLDLHQEVSARAAQARRLRVFAALVGALLAGALTWLLLDGRARDAGGAAPPEPVVPPARQLEVAPPAGAPAGGAAGSEQRAGPAPATDAPPAAVPAALPTQMPDPNLDAEQLAARRAQAALAIRALPGLLAAQWSSQSTMLVTVAPGSAVPQQDRMMDAACSELARFEELRYTRLQVQAADVVDGAAAPAVRWRLCR